MYRIGDKVMHRQEGACFIRQIVDMEINNNTKKYYRLVPILNEHACVYVSTEKTKQENIRPVIAQSELKAAIESLSDNTMEWEENPKQRISNFTQRSADFRFDELLSALICLKEQNERKKLNAKDEQFMISSQKMVCSELAILLDVDYDKVLMNLRSYLML